jgi:hypothetical protein
MRSLTGRLNRPYLAIGSSTGPECDSAPPDRLHRLYAEAGHSVQGGKDDPRGESPLHQRWRVA